MVCVVQMIKVPHNVTLNFFLNPGRFLAACRPCLRIGYANNLWLQYETRSIGLNLCNYKRQQLQNLKRKKMLKLIVLYPHPSDIKKFEKDYKAHLQLTHEKMGMPNDVIPYKVTKMLPNKVTKMLPMPTGLPHFYQMFSLPFNSPEDLQAAMASQGMQDVAADAQRISKGGPLVVMIGNED
jgi:uncharacterized protein (TIGR02118 family)